MVTPPSGTVMVFVNERPVHLAQAGTLADAVRAADDQLVAALDDGRAYLTDGRGVRSDPTDPLAPGAIIRVIVSARRPGPDADT